MSDYTALIAEIADLARRIGPVNTPAWIRGQLEDLAARHGRWAEAAALRPRVDVPRLATAIGEAITLIATGHHDEARLVLCEAERAAERLAGQGAIAARHRRQLGPATATMLNRFRGELDRQIRDAAGKNRPAEDGDETDIGFTLGQISAILAEHLSGEGKEMTP